MNFVLQFISLNDFLFFEHGNLSKNKRFKT